MNSAPTPLDVMCPMHAVLEPDGRIMHLGPTLRKIMGQTDACGRPFLDVFDVTRPQGVQSSDALIGLVGRTLHLKPHAGPQTSMKAVVAERPDGAAGAIVNMSFGISVVEAVQTYGLSNADFAPTDLTVEMLYLVEAKSAVMAASRRLNERLQDAKLIAEKQAVTDTLTGLENRRGFEKFLASLLARQARFAVLHLDLDGFKQVNDTMGHDAGDLVLQMSARIMTEEVRDRDLVARIGGDEFILVIDGDPSRATIDLIGARLIDRIAALDARIGGAPALGCSIGAVLSADIPAPNTRDILKAADIALYASKRTGRGRLTVFTPDPKGRQLLDEREGIAKPAL